MCCGKRYHFMNAATSEGLFFIDCEHLRRDGGQEFSDHRDRLPVNLEHRVQRFGVERSQVKGEERDHDTSDQVVEQVGLDIEQVAWAIGLGVGLPLTMKSMT